MANLIGLFGPSGTGKSTSLGEVPELDIKGLNPEETVILSISGKPLPFRGWKKKFPLGERFFVTEDHEQVVNLIGKVNSERSDIKNIVIDDAGYLMTFVFMDKANEKGYDKFSKIAEAGYKPLAAAKRADRDDLNIIFIFHDEDDGSTGRRKIRTSGKMIDNHLSIEGLFTVVLASVMEVSKKKEVSYHFVTNNDGVYGAKSPVGMFPELKIKNDMGEVLECVRKYNEGE